MRLCIVTQRDEPHGKPAFFRGVFLLAKRPKVVPWSESLYNILGQGKRISVDSLQEMVKNVSQGFSL